MELNNTQDVIDVPTSATHWLQQKKGDSHG
jgi:hypothetical protein